MSMTKLIAQDNNNLLIATAQGDRSAFSRLYDNTSAKLFGLALRILKRHDLAEEAVQDAYVSIWNQATTFRPEKASAMTWMTTIVRNRCIDLYRAMPPEQQLPADGSLDAWLSDDMTPLEIIASNNDTRSLLNCMQKLAPLQRQAIALSYFYDMAHEQLSGHLAQPLGTIKTWLRRGLQSLKKCMGAAF
jgi:RNA polymerase sigma-70 factor, ECF subfamily